MWNRQVRDLQKTVPPSIHKSVLAAVRFHDEWLMTGVRCYQLAVPFMALVVGSVASGALVVYKLGTQAVMREFQATA